MEQPSKEMGLALAKVTFQAGNLPVYSNVTSEPVLDAGLWPSLLEAQLRSPVRWTESVQNMRRDGIETFVECGVGEVLSGLLRRIDKEATGLKVNDQSSYFNTITVLEGKTGA